MQRVIANPASFVTPDPASLRSTPRVPSNTAIAPPSVTVSTLGIRFERELQRINARRLAQVASERSLDVDARRLFVKTWVNLLDIQSLEGERQIEDQELKARYSGSFESMDADTEFEP